MTALRSGVVLPVPVVRLDPDLPLPGYAHHGDAGLDLFAVAEQDIPAGQWRKVPTGIAIALPPCCEAQIRPRSGLAAEHGITVLNAPGTIDAGYRGEIAVLLINHGPATCSIRPGMKIAQMVVSEVTRVTVAEVSALDDSTRGTGGFGSTGM